jgi:membrane protein required for beta-lactamase induction
MQLKNGDKTMTLTNKIVLMICLMMGTAMFINGLNNIMYEVGGVYILSYTISIVMLCVGIRILTRVEDSTDGRRRTV